MKINPNVLSALLAGLMIVSSARGEQAPDPYRAVLPYRFNHPRTALKAIEAEIHSANAEQLRAIEGKLLAVLQSPQATPECKDWVCRQLRQAGSEQSVPALAALVGDKDLATVARWALQSIPGAKVDAALRESLGKVEGLLKAGVLQTIGARRDQQAVGLVGSLVSEKDPAVAESAIYALGQMGSREALGTLQKAQVPQSLRRYRDEAMLLCAERMAAEGKTEEAFAVYQMIGAHSEDVAVKIGAIQGCVAAGKAHAAQQALAALKSDLPRLRVAAAKCVCEAGGAELVRTVASELSSLPEDSQTTILTLVKDKTALAAVSAAAKSANPGIRAAALRALGRIGDASSLGLLLKVAVAEQGDVQAGARESLQALQGREVTAGLLGAAQSGEAAMRAEAVRILTSRRAMEAIPVLFKLAQEEEPLLRAEAINGLTAIGTCQSVPRLLKMLAEGKTEDQRTGAEKAIIAIWRRTKFKNAVANWVAESLPGPNLEARCALLRILGRTPSDKGLESLRAAAGDAEGVVKDTAVRGLADWPDAAPIPDLVVIARTTDNRSHKVLAVRGLVRLIALPSERPAEETVKLLADALALASRVEEKKAVLAVLGELSHPAALGLGTGCLAEKDLEVEAATAVVKIAKGVQRTDADAAAAAVRKVLEVCKTPAARQIAEGAMVLSGDMVNIAPQGIASSPDGLEKDGNAGDDQAAIDSNTETYWDEADGQPLYRLVVTLKQPETVAAISLMGFQQHGYAPKDFEILCDGKVVKKIENAQYDNNLLAVPLGDVTCSSVELKITGYYGQSPAVRELGIYRRATK